MLFEDRFMRIMKGDLVELILTRGEAVRVLEECDVKIASLMFLLGEGAKERGEDIFLPDLLPKLDLKLMIRGVRKRKARK